MSSTGTTIVGIDLGTTYSCIAYVDEYGKPVVVPNSEGDGYTTPSVVYFDGTNRVVGREAKNSALITPRQVAEMVKRHMGEENWQFHYEGIDYTAEEISSYILRKLTDDAEQELGHAVKEVVITCPAYFGIAQRDATAKAGQLAGLHVLEVINEPTAAAIMYGLQEGEDQTVLVYDLGGGTFDVTVIKISNKEITVISTDGEHYLGGRNWDEKIVYYLAQKWMEENKSTDNPMDSEETLQDLWVQAEKAKKTLSVRQETRPVVAHAGQRIALTLTRAKFNELTSDLLDRTISFTHKTIAEAMTRGHEKFDQILLVGGSTRMPQITERLKAEFDIPLKSFDPDQAVAKGAAVYGYKLILNDKVRKEIAEITGNKADTVDVDMTEKKIINEAVKRVAEEEGLVLGAVKQAIDLRVTNVASHSFGVVAFDPRINKEIISNIVLANDPLPAVNKEFYQTQDPSQATVELKVIENSIGNRRVEDLMLGQEIGNAVLHLPYGLPQAAPIEVTFDLQRDGRLHIIGCEPGSGAIIEADIQTTRGISEEEFKEAQQRSTSIVIS